MPLVALASYGMVVYVPVDRRPTKSEASPAPQSVKPLPVARIA